jgi:hypothetical protein
MALNGTGQVGPMGTSLHVTVHGRQWGISIRRIDMDSDPAFGPYHDQAVTDAHIKAIIPHWENLAWSHHGPPFPGLPRESRATDGAYRVYLIYPGGGDLQPNVVLEQFQADLA